MAEGTTANICYYLSQALTSIGIEHVLHYDSNRHLIKTKFQKAAPIATNLGKRFLNRILVYSYHPSPRKVIALILDNG